MTDKTRPDRPADDLEHRLARVFRSEVERARVDLAGRPLANRPAMVSRAALPFGPLAAAVVIVVLALLLRPPGAGEPPGASLQGAPSGTNVGSPSASSPTPSQQPPSEDWALITWSLTPTEPFGGPGNQFLTDVTAWHDGFVAVGHECCGAPRTGLVWSSPDGRSWERVPDCEHVFQAATLDFIEAAGDQLMVGGRFGETAAIWLSDDGRDWRLATPGDPFDGGHVEGMAWGTAGLIAYGWQADHGVTWSSRDGISWEPDAATFRDSGPNGPTIAGTAWGYVATSAAGAWWSLDGRSWTRATVEDDARLGRVVVGSGGLLAAGETGPLPANNATLGGPTVMPEYWHSFDGRAWRRIPPSEDEPAGPRDSLISDGSRIVAMRPTRELWSSTDGRSWRQLTVAADPTVDLEVSSLTGFSRAAVGRHGIIGGDHAPVVGTEENADAAVWFGAATATVPRQIEKLPLLHNDGRNDAMCIGGEGGDPGVVCIEIGYYLRNESSQDRLVRLRGAVEALLVAPAGSVGRLTEIGPVWDSGLPVVVEVLSDDCQVLQRLTPTGDLALIVIPADSQARIEAPPPPEPLPQTPFAATDACTG
jgi:hypothetical protein